jgi:hypothetical protein
MMTVERWTRVCASLILIGLTGTAHGADQTAPQSPAPPAVSGARVCGSQPFCAEEVSFAAAITDFQATLQNTSVKTLTVRLRVHNKLNHPLALGYVSGSGIATDERGNRYTISGERAVQGIGVIQGNSGDPKFLLQVGETSDARFEFAWSSSGQEIFGIVFQIDLAIREIDPLPGGQMRLGREHALHFAGLGNRGTSATPRTTAAPPGAPPSSAAGVPPSAAPASAPQVDACAGRQRCYNAGPFVAEVTRITQSQLQGDHLLDINVRFQNLTNRRTILAYGDRSSSSTDNYGNRYQSSSSIPPARGIGTMRSNRPDPQFVLDPGATGNAIFTVYRTLGRNPIGTTFSFDVSIAQLEELPGQQVRTVRDYSVGFSALSPVAPIATTLPFSAQGIVPAADACAGKPRCYGAASFIAEVIGVTQSQARGDHLLDINVRFQNPTSQPVILAYVDRSSIGTDNNSNRYRGTISLPAVKGIGIVRGDQADPQFVLNPGASKNVTFTVFRTLDKNPIGTIFDFEATIAQLEILPSRQIIVVRDYAVDLPNLTTSGTSLLNKLLKGPPLQDVIGTVAPWR